MNNFYYFISFLKLKKQLFYFFHYILIFWTYLIDLLFSYLILILCFLFTKNCNSFDEFYKVIVVASNFLISHF